MEELGGRKEENFAYWMYDVETVLCNRAAVLSEAKITLGIGIQKGNIIRTLREAFPQGRGLKESSPQGLGQAICAYIIVYKKY